MGFQDFDQDIKNGLKPVYLFYGQERYLMDQMLEKMIQTYVPDTYRDFNLVTFDGEKVSPDEIIDACETVPFFNETKIILVKNAPFFRATKSQLTDAGEKRLLDYFAEPLESSKLFFISNHSIDKRKKVTKTVGKCGSLVEYGKLEPNIFKKWMHKKIKTLGKDIDGGTLTYLVQRMAYLDKLSTKNLLDVDNELKMICSSLIERKDVTADDINQFVKKPLEADIFVMVDAVGRKQAEKAIVIMHELMKQGEPIIKIYSMICRQFRILKKTKMLAEDGYNQASIAKMIGVHPYAVKKIMSQLNVFDSRSLTYILEKCSDLDYKMKSTSINSELAVEALIVECSLMRR